MIDSRIAEAYEKYCDDLVVYATAISGASEAEDVVAEAMVRLIRTADWDRIATPRAYLYRCVFNEAVSRGRRSGLRRVKERAAPTRSETHVLSGVDELGVFTGLSMQERAVVYLTYWHDLKPAAAAELLGVSEGAVRGYLGRARKKLRKELQS